MIEVSAGVIYDESGRILLCQRGEGRNNAHLWEFPGGKREAGESAEACLVRELQEELHLPITDVRADTVYIHGDIVFTFLTAKTDAQPVLTEHEDARFVTVRDLLHFDLCPADRPMAELLCFRQVRHVFWDFDGTLMDSYPAMVRAFVAAAADFGIAITSERALSLMKVNLTHCCETVGAENSIGACDLLTAFRRHEQTELEKGLPPVEGIPETLQALHDQGVRHYVATHRDLTCRDLLEKAGLLPYFTDFVTAENGLPRKPAPDMLLHLMQKHHLDPSQCMMVGDRPLDTEAGMAAGVFSVLLDVDHRFLDGERDVSIPAPWLLSHNIT